MPPNHQSINLIIPLIKQTMIQSCWWLLWWRKTTKNFCISGWNFQIRYFAHRPIWIFRSRCSLLLLLLRALSLRPTLHAVVVRNSASSSSFVGRKTLIHLEKESPTLLWPQRSQNWPHQTLVYSTKQWWRESACEMDDDNENSLFVAQDKGQRRTVCWWWMIDKVEPLFVWI